MDLLTTWKNDFKIGWKRKENDLYLVVLLNRSYSFSLSMAKFFAMFVVVPHLPHPSLPLQKNKNKTTNASHFFRLNFVKKIFLIVIFSISPYLPKCLCFAKQNFTDFFFLFEFSEISIYNNGKKVASSILANFQYKIFSTISNVLFFPCISSFRNGLYQIVFAPIIQH